MADQLNLADMTEEEIVGTVNTEYAEKYGFADAEDYVYKAEEGS